MTDTMPQTAPTDTSRAFSALAWVEGRWTGDGRLVLVDAVTWDGILPMPLTVDHEGVTETVGRVDRLERAPGATADERFIVAYGVLDLGSPLGLDMERLIESRYVNGVSMELDATVEGGIDPNTAPEDMPAGSGGWVMVVEAARVRALSIVTTAAFAEAHITFDDQPAVTGLPPAIDGPAPLTHDELPAPEDSPEEIIIVASGHIIELPTSPPAAWFQQPTDVNIEGSLTVTDEGRVYGWLAPANVPYSGVAGNFTAPLGAVNYRNWMRGETVCAAGDRVVTGNITMGCGHGDTQTTDHQAVRDHYDNSCSLFARVAAGETADGVWVAGALYPGVTGEQVERAMGLQCSGHWLPSLTPGYRYDLMAALLVPVPGFSMARRAPSVTVKDGTMAASAVPVRFAEDCGCGGDLSLVDRIADLERRIARAETPALVASLQERMGPLVAAHRVAALRARIAG